jgi:hypothetical protein
VALRSPTGGREGSGQEGRARQVRRDGPDGPRHSSSRPGRDAWLVVNRTQLDPDRVLVKGAFKPYEEVGETTVTRRDAGNLSHLRFDTKIRCLEYECLTQRITTITDPGAGAPRVFRFKPTRVLYTEPGKDEPRLLRAIRWPQLETVSRINGQDPAQLFGFPFRWDVFPLPALSRRFAPSLLAALARARGPAARVLLSR